MIEARFPPEISKGAQGGPQWDVSVVRSKGGYQQRTQHYDAPLRRWSVSHIKNLSDFRTLRNFVLAVGGPFESFRFKDWNGYQSEGQQATSPATGDAANQAFQLQITYTSPAGNTVRTITKPVSGTVKVYLNGVEQLSGWTVDTTTGIITFTSPPGAGVAVTAEFEFDVPARLVLPGMDARQQHSDLFDWESIEIEEVRE